MRPANSRDVRPTHLDLFAGIGGFSLAAHWAGFNTVAHAEVCPDASRVLEYWWPGVPNLGDVRALDAEKLRLLGPVDLITAGVPCQPASNLGKRRGTADDRWLWPETIGLIRCIRPRYFVAENPPALLSLEGGRAFNGIVGGLAALGYVGFYDVLPAAAIGAGHLRERVIIVAADANSARLEGHARDESPAARREVETRSTSSPPLRSDHNRSEVSIEPGIFTGFDGVSERMASMLDMNSPLYYWVSHGATSFTYTPEVLRALQEGAFQKAVRLSFGRQNGVSEAQVLRPDLHGGSDGEDAENSQRVAAGRSAPPQALLRDLRLNQETPCPPQGRGLEQQQRDQSSNALRELPHQASLEVTQTKARRLTVQSLQIAISQVKAGALRQALSEAQEAWKRLSEDEKDWCFVAACNGGFLNHPKPGIPPLVSGLPARLAEPALRCVGNTVVPQVALTILDPIFQELTR